MKTLKTLTLFLVMLTIAAWLNPSETQENIQGEPSTLSELIGHSIQTIGFNKNYQYVEITRIPVTSLMSGAEEMSSQRNDTLLDAIGNWPLDIGFSADWYQVSPLGNDGRPIRIFCIFTTQQEDEYGKCDFYSMVFVDKDNDQILYPAFWSQERMWGDHEDPDLKNHPDLGWWSMDRSYYDAFMDSVSTFYTLPS